MKDKPVRRTSKAAREAAEKEITELLPALESAAAEPEERQAEMKKSADRARVEKTMAYTAESVTRQIAEMQLSVNRMLTDLSQQLREESGKLAEIRLAIETENTRLRELHEIDAALLSLKAILEVAAERRATLEAELNQRDVEIQEAIERRKGEWNAEQTEFETRTKKGREREEEDYGYKLSLKRRKEADDYAAQQAALQRKLQDERSAAEHEIEEREHALAARGGEVKDLQTRVEKFPQELAAATKQAEQGARAEAQKQAALEAKLLKMEADGERNVTALKISGLEDLLKRQAVQLAEMTKQLGAAQTQVQTMAVKAIEGAAGMKNTTAP